MVSTRSKRTKAADIDKSAGNLVMKTPSIQDAVDSTVSNTTDEDKGKDVVRDVEARVDHENDTKGNAEVVEESFNDQTQGAGLQTSTKNGDDGQVCFSGTKESTKSIKLVKKGKKTKPQEEGVVRKNSLAKLLPGYTAPLCLEAPSLQRYRTSSTLDNLVREASKEELTKTKKALGVVLEKSRTSGLPESYLAAASSFKQGVRKRKEPGLSNWFGMRSSEQTEELKRDLQLIRNRNYLSSNRFYKNPDKNKSGVVQLGTVIEGAAEYYSSRLTKKQRRSNLVDEILADPESSSYVQNKYRERQRANQEKYEKHRKQFRKRHSR